MKSIITALILLLVANSAHAYNVKQLFVEMREKFNEINDYECIMKDYQSKGGKSERYIYNFYYKKPEKIRMDIIGGDNNIGTVLIYRNGKVKVRPGKGLLSLFTFTLDPRNKRILGLNGFAVNESAGDYFLDMHIENLETFEARLLREEELDGTESLVVELISKDLDKTSLIARELVWVDKEKLLLLKFIFYDAGGNIMQSTQYENLRINVGLDDELFRKTSYKRK